MLWADIWKITEFFTWKFSFLVVKFSVYLDRCVFVMCRMNTIDNLVDQCLNFSLPYYLLSFSTCKWYISVLQTSYFELFRTIFSLNNWIPHILTVHVNSSILVHFDASKICIMNDNQCWNWSDGRVLWRLICVYTVCTRVSFGILRVNIVPYLLCSNTLNVL